MAIFMPNIARRKIIETMREFESLLLEIEFFCMTDEKFNGSVCEFSEIKKNIYISISKINILLVAFFHNENFLSPKDYEVYLENLSQDKKRLKAKLKTCKNLPFTFFWLNKRIEWKENLEMKNLSQGRVFLKLIKSFNNYLPKFVEIRRDKIKVKKNGSIFRK